MFTSPPELIGAITDLINAFVSVILIFITYSINDSDKRRKYLFYLLYASVAFTGLYGFIIHAFLIPDSLTVILWGFLYPAMYVMPAVFSLITVVTYYPHLRLKKISFILSVPTLICCLLTEFILFKTDINAIYPFIIFAAVTLIPSLIIYFIKAISKKDVFSRFMLTGLIFQVIGAFFQATRSISFTIIWEFDYNSIYHILLTISLFLFYAAHSHIDKTTSI